MNDHPEYLPAVVSPQSAKPISLRDKMVPGSLPGSRMLWMSKNRYWINSTGISMLGIVLMLSVTPSAMGNHKGAEAHHVEGELSSDETGGHSIPGAPFQVFMQDSQPPAAEGKSSQAANAVLQTVIEAFIHLMEHRTEYHRFHEALTKEAVHKVIIEPKVVNREGKEFPFLVVRTSRPDRVNLLISASALEEKGYLDHPDLLVPVLAREFQWVVSKSDTTPKRPMDAGALNFKQAPIKTNQQIEQLSGEERERVLKKLFQTYLTTTDRHASLEGQSSYETGTITRIPPVHPDSTTKLYDIRVREALQKIVREPYFQEHMPKAVRSLLNGKIWNVAFADIPSREWATRTRVVPKEKSITAGEHDTTIQPAMVLINIHRSAAPEDPFFAETKGLPMGALPVEVLASVIAREIQDHITEKSMRGHTAQDELRTP